MCTEMGKNNNEATTSNEYSIQELAKYYINRYSLPTNNRSDSHYNAGNGYKPYIKEISQLIKGAQIGNVSLWTKIKPQKGVRRISIELFEEHCFEKWSEYIKRNTDDLYDKEKLQKDIEASRIKYAEARAWNDKAKRAIEAHNHAMETEEYFDEDHWRELTDYDPTVSDEKLKEIGIRMIIEALFEVYYEPFNWELLKKDLENVPMDDGYNPDITPSIMQSQERLKTFKSYSKRKKRETS